MSLSSLRSAPCLESAAVDSRRTAEWDLHGTVPEAPGTMKLFPAEERSESTEHLETERPSAKLEGPSWMAERHTGGPSRGPRALTWRPWTRPWGQDTAMQYWWVLFWRTSQTSRPVVRPIGQILVVDAPWPSSTQCSLSCRLWTGNLPGCCRPLVDGREPKLSPYDRTTSAGATSSAWVCKIVCLPRSWCKPLSLRCRTSSAPLGTSDEEGSLSQRWWRPASPERWYWAPQPELDASVKRVTSISLVARGRPCRTAGVAHQATSDRTHWGTVILSDQFPVLWHQAVAAHHWTGLRWSLPHGTREAINTTMPSNLWRSQAVLGWSSSVGEQTGLWDTSSVGAPLWTVECWTASLWTGSPHLVLGLTPRCLNRATTGCKCLVNSRGEVANPKGRQVNL